MSGPVRPPLTTKESDDSVTVRPTNTLSFDATDFSVVKSGTTATVSSTGGGGTIGGSIAAGQIAFGSAADTITGSSSLRYDDTNKKLTLIGDSDDDSVFEIIGSDTAAGAGPRLTITNDTGTNSSLELTMDNYAVGILEAGTLGATMRSVMQFGQMSSDEYTVVFNEGGLSADFRIESNGNENMFFVDGSMNTIGIAGVAQTDATLTIYDTNDQDVLLRLETDEDSNDKSPTLEFFKNSAADISDYIMSIDVYGLDSGGAKSEYARIATYIEDETAATENAVLNFQVAEAGSLRSNLIIGSTLVTINASARNVDFRHLADDNIANIYSDAGTGTVAIRGAANSDSTLTIYDTGTAGDANLELISTQDDLNAAPIMQFFRDDIPSASDQSIGEIDFYGRDLAGTKLRMAQITAFVNDATAGGVESQLLFESLRSSTAVTLATWDSYNIDFNSGKKDMDFNIRSDDRDNMFNLDGNENFIGIYSSASLGIADNNPRLQVDGSISGKMPVIVANADLTLVRDGMSGQTYVCTDGGTTALTMPLGALQGDYCYFVSSSGSIQIVVDVGTQTLNGGTLPLTRTTNNEIYTVLCIEDNKFILSNPA